MKPRVVLMWFRRDLRLTDNCALYHALQQGLPVLPLFIFDRDILDELPLRNDRRVHFIHKAVRALHGRLQAQGSALLCARGRVPEVFAELSQNYDIAAVYANEDYEPYALRRDAGLQAGGLPLRLYKDHVLYACGEVVKPNGAPYTVFTPYSRRWKERLLQDGVPHYPLPAGPGAFFRFAEVPAVPALQELGFEPAPCPEPLQGPPELQLEAYESLRDYPAAEATSRLSVQIRFGTVSIRQVIQQAAVYPRFLNEIIWREFYQMICCQFPHVRQGFAFKKEYDNIRWRDDEAGFNAWCRGVTGYPLVDAGMRELNATGYMHNRLRMVTASFLCKHLLIDWRRGEQYFAERLIDYDFASNNGGWQWAAGTGCDAAPYFRIFNPALQAKRFDPDGVYIRRWVPEWGTAQYPPPVVEHGFARQRALERYRQALGPEASP